MILNESSQCIEKVWQHPKILMIFQRILRKTKIRWFCKKKN